MRVRSSARLLLVVCVLALGACAANNRRAEDFNAFKGGSDAVILVLPVDAELSELSFGGYPTTRRDWTLTAREHMNANLRSALQKKSVSAVFGETQEPDETTAKLLRVHAAVGQSIMSHQYDGPAKLPTKASGFDWTLGTDARALGQGSAANYALFIHVRDSYSSAGRVMAQAIAAAVFGVAIQGGAQTGFASLVDLQTGQVVWFNRLLRAAGDLRTHEAAMETVEVLLAGLPE
jgi:hypothetical protein